jgi:hypothetical protein
VQLVIKDPGGGGGQLIFFGAPKNIFYFNFTVSGCDGGHRTRNIHRSSKYIWRLSLLSYDRHLIELRPPPN